MNQRFSITPANAATDLRLTDSVHRTLTVIGIFGDKNGWCWPSQSTLAEMRGVSRKTINLHIKDLIAFGYLNIAPRYDDETGAQKSNMMQIKFDFVPDVTGGVTSKMLQGGGSPEGYTPHNPQDVTHNAPLNAPKERSAAVIAYENTFGPITYKASQCLNDDIDTYGETAVLAALAKAKERRAKSYAYVETILRGNAEQASDAKSIDDIWETITKASRTRSWKELPPNLLTAVRKVGGQSRIREVKPGFETNQLKKELANYVQ